MITVEDIKKMGLSECTDTHKRLWNTKNPNIELIKAAEERIARLNRDNAIVEMSEIKVGEV